MNIAKYVNVRPIYSAENPWTPPRGVDRVAIQSGPVICAHRPLMTAAAHPYVVIFTYLYCYLCRGSIADPHCGPKSGGAQLPRFPRTFRRVWTVREDNPKSIRNNRVIYTDHKQR